MDIPFRYCPVCGEYWNPLADEMAKGVRSPRCRRCAVRVEFTGLFVVLFGMLVCAILGWIDGTVGRIPPSGVALVFGAFLVLACLRWTRQYRAARKKDKTVRTGL
jgi:uncharacterized membrane protein YfcA